MTAAQPAKEKPPEGSIKETLISLAISFVMALVFRSYVVEAFVIPTGSMAPTLLGAHIQFRSPQSGFEWAVNPWYAVNETPVQPQGNGPHGPPSATDPMSTSLINRFTSGGRSGVPHGFVTNPEVKRLRAGDRILVQKYLYELFPPERWDVVVFKNPELATQNFIKRLVALPNEQVWLADGDVFTRPVTKQPDGSVEVRGEWSIQRKPDRVQRAVWWPVFASDFAPLSPERDGREWFSSPWRGEGWTTGPAREYRTESEAPTTLAWDLDKWPIWDWVPYNEIPERTMFNRQVQMFPVADLRIRAGVRADREGLVVSATIASHGHEWRAEFDGGTASISTRAAGAQEWTTMANAPAPRFAPGRFVDVEFWRADQALEVWVDGRKIVEASYDWSPAERLRRATGLDVRAFADGEDDVPLWDAATYRNAVPRVEWSFRGSPVTLSRVGLDRDLYYEPVAFYGGRQALATSPANLAALGEREYFMLGDNSPASKDGRLWTELDPRINEQIDTEVGVVHRKLILGKAFFVYFPAPHSLGNAVPIPDFGRMRFIR